MKKEVRCDNCGVKLSKDDIRRSHKTMKVLCPKCHTISHKITHKYRSRAKGSIYSYSTEKTTRENLDASGNFTDVPAFQVVVHNEDDKTNYCLPMCHDTEEQAQKIIDEIIEEEDKDYEKKKMKDKNMKKLLNKFQPLEYRIEKQNINATDTLYNIKEYNTKTGKERIVRVVKDAKKAVVELERLIAEHAKDAFRQGEELGELMKREERRDKEGKQVKDLSELVKDLGQKEREKKKKKKRTDEIIKKKNEQAEKIAKKEKEEAEAFLKKYPFPDILVKCINNAGYEEHFEKGISYIFKKRTKKDFMMVEDMFANDVEVFGERFEVLPLELPWTLNETTMKPVRSVRSMFITCEDCNGEGIQMTMKCYGDSPIEVMEECETCGGDGEIEVPVDDMEWKGFKDDAYEVRFLNESGNVTDEPIFPAKVHYKNLGTEHSEDAKDLIDKTLQQISTATSIPKEYGASGSKGANGYQSTGASFNSIYSQMTATQELEGMMDDMLNNVSEEDMTDENGNVSKEYFDNMKSIVEAWKI